MSVKLDPKFSGTEEEQAKQIAEWQRALEQTFKDKTDDTSDAADLPRVQQTKARSFLRRFRKNS